MNDMYDHQELANSDAFSDWLRKVSESSPVADKKSVMQSQPSAEAVVRSRAEDIIAECIAAAKSTPKDDGDVLILRLEDMIVRKQPKVEPSSGDGEIFGVPHGLSPTDVCRLIKDARVSGHVINDHNEPKFARVRLFSENLSAALWYNVVLKVLPKHH